MQSIVKYYSITYLQTTYALAWARRGDRLKLAVGSFKEEYTNEVRVIQVKDEHQMQNDTDHFHELAKFEHLYPTTKVTYNGS